MAPTNCEMWSVFVGGTMEIVWRNGAVKGSRLSDPVLLCWAQLYGLLSVAAGRQVLQAPM